MTKNRMKMMLGIANIDRTLQLSPYWVKDAWLIRITDRAGNRVPGGYVLITGGHGPDPDGERQIKELAQTRDKIEAEKLRGRKTTLAKTPAFQMLDLDLPDLDLDLDLPDDDDYDDDRIENWPTNRPDQFKRHK
jgi:hypothetical protein